MHKHLVASAHGETANFTLLQKSAIKLIKIKSFKFSDKLQYDCMVSGAARHIAIYSAMSVYPLVNAIHPYRWGLRRNNVDVKPLYRRRFMFNTGGPFQTSSYVSFLRVLALPLVRRLCVDLLKVYLFTCGVQFRSAYCMAHHVVPMHTANARCSFD